MQIDFQMLDSLMRWVVVPLAAFIWVIYQRQQDHHTDIEVLKTKQEASKQAHDREMKELRDTIKAIFQKLDTIEQALRK